MSDFSRRRFFNLVRHQVADVMQSVTSTFAGERLHDLPVTIDIGHISEFKPGEKYTKQSLVVMSSSDGISAYDVQADTYRPVILERTGFMKVDMKGHWPAGSYLHIMTGEQRTM